MYINITQDYSDPGSAIKDYHFVCVLLFLLLVTQCLTTKLKEVVFVWVGSLGALGSIVAGEIGGKSV